MLAFLLGLFRLVFLFGKDHRAVVLENLALRQQLSIYKRKHKRPRLVEGDRWFWIGLSVVWKDWRRALMVVHPDTVVRWQRERFRRYWTQLSKTSRRAGRPSIGRQIRELIQAMALANVTWRAPRIHGELQKLGIAISERTVSRFLRTIKRPPSQTWRTFLRNHLGEIVAIDFFTVPTIRLRVLFVFLVMEHERRRVLHFGVSEHPTAEWTGQQVVEAFSDREAKQYLIRSRLDLRQRLSPSSPIAGSERSHHRSPQSLAKCLCRTVDRLDSARMPRSCGGSQSKASSPSPKTILY